MDQRPEPVNAQILQAHRGLTELSIKLALDARSIGDREMLAETLSSLEAAERRLHRVWERMQRQL